MPRFVQFLIGIMPDDGGKTTMSIWRKLTCAAILGLAMSAGGAGSAAAQSKPEGEMRYAVYVTIAPAWLDPGETGPGNLTPSGCCTRCTTRS
jgi:hypothetical protein